MGRRFGTGFGTGIGRWNRLRRTNRLESTMPVEPGVFAVGRMQLPAGRLLDGRIAVSMR
jgi:hypothetical protein